MPKWQRVLASLQFFGGMACAAGALFPDSTTSQSVHFTIPLFSLFAGAIAVAAAFLLIVREELGLWVSFAVQTAQVLSLNVGARYVFLAGLKLQWVVSSAGTGFFFGGGGLGSATFTPGNGALAGVGLAGDANIGFFWEPLASASWAIGINFAALYFAVKLWRALESTHPTGAASAHAA